MLKATILIPTHNHGRTLWYACRSALNQTIQDLEVLIVGDGATPPTRETAQELVRSDSRVQFLEFPKGSRNGERYRHEVLQKARGQIVCYLSDDDLWMPDHVETMLALAQRADFLHALPLRIEPDGTLSGWTVDLALPAERELFFKGINRIPLSCGAHTMALYRRLSYGWRTTPAGIWTDLYMWQQILSLADCRVASGTRPTVLHFPSPDRVTMTLEERCAEIERWSERISDRTWAGRFVYDVLDHVVRDRAAQVAEARTQIFHQQQEISDLKGHLTGLMSSPWWRLRGTLLSLPVLGPFLRWAAKLVWRQ